MSYPEILHHGATQGVTGSCHQLLMDAQHSLLIDCGLFQGAETSAEGRAGAGSLAIDFALDTVKALIATHVHVDHVGRIPYLLAAGFKGPILCSEPSAKLLPIVLEDAFKLGVSSDQRQVERYLELIGQRSIALPYKHWFTLADTSTLLCRIRLQRAGHILGSAYVEIDLTYKAIGRKRRILFSGDLGAPHAPLLPAPRPPYRADTLVIESTYGDRLHEDRRSRRQRLETMIEQALADRGSVLIPAFSIGRTQELLYELEEIIYRKTRSRPAAREADVRSSSHADWPQLPIILDSPLASRFTQAYRELQPFWDREATKRARSGRQPLGFEQLITVENHADHLRMVEHLASTARPPGHRHRRQRHVHQRAHRQLPESHAGRSSAQYTLRRLPGHGHARACYPEIWATGRLRGPGRRAPRDQSRGRHPGRLFGPCRSAGTGEFHHPDARVAGRDTPRPWRGRRQACARCRTAAALCGKTEEGEHYYPLRMS